MVRREYYGQLRSFFSEVSNYEGSRSKKKKKKGPILERTYFGSYEIMFVHVYYVRTYCTKW